MPDIVVVRYPGGLRPPARLELSGGAPYGVQPGRPLTLDWLDDRGDILFHLNARPEQDAVVLNSHLDGAWGEEVVVPGCPIRRELDLRLELRVDVLRDRFRVFADGRHLCDFEHRQPPAAITRVRCSGWFWRLQPARHRLLGGRRGTALQPEIVPLGRDRARIEGSADDWVHALDNPGEPQRLESFRLFAVLNTWLEEDVVAATVANCFHQGCERVFVVDNESPDRTVERAVAAGAEVGRVYRTDRFDKEEKMRLMRSVVEEVSAAGEAGHVWWLWLDADEFYHGPGGSTLREYLEGLDRRFRIVGARFFQHYPTNGAGYVEGRHPLDFQPRCFELALPNCELGHPRHPLQRWDRDGEPIVPLDGFHVAECAEPLLEPTLPVVFHHFPYRAEVSTRQRLARLSGADGGVSRIDGIEDAGYHMRLRLRSVDAVYRGRWQDVAFYPPLARGYVPELRDWDEWVGAAERDVGRWYPYRGA